MFAIFGLNGFLHFMKLPPPATALGGQFMTVGFESHFLLPIFLLQFLAGLMLLAGLYVPLTLVVLAAIIVNILDYHLTMDPGGILLALVATVLWVVTALGYRPSFDGLLVRRIDSPNAAAARDRQLHFER